MRNLKVLTATAAAVCTLGIGGVVAAGPTTPQTLSPAQPPPTVPDGASIDAVLDVLTPEQITCVMEGIGTVDTTDMSAMLDLLTQCGVTTEQLLDIGQASSEGGEPGGDAPVAVPGDSTDAGAEATFTVVEMLAMVGLEPADIECISAAVTATPPTDDQGALQILTDCGISLSELLTALSTVDVSGGATPMPSPEPADPTTTTAGGDGAGAEATNPIVQMIVDELAKQGIDVTPEQAQCLLDAVTGGIDMSDTDGMLAIVQECGIM